MVGAGSPSALSSPSAHMEPPATGTAAGAHSSAASAEKTSAADKSRLARALAWLAQTFAGLTWPRLGIFCLVIVVISIAEGPPNRVQTSGSGWADTAAAFAKAWDAPAAPVHAGAAARRGSGESRAASRARPRPRTGVCDRRRPDSRHHPLRDRLAGALSRRVHGGVVRVRVQSRAEPDGHVAVLCGLRNIHPRRQRDRDHVLVLPEARPRHARGVAAGASGPRGSRA